MRHDRLTRRGALAVALGGVGATVTRRGHAAPTPRSQDAGLQTSRPPLGSGERFEPQPNRLFVTPYDNDPFTIEVEEQLKCTCGCQHNVYECRLTDFSCSFWPQHHADIVQQVTAGWSAEQIIDEYVGRHGGEYLMAPPAEGFNLVAYLLPGTLILAGGALLLLHLRRAALVAADGPTVTPIQSQDVGALTNETESLLAKEMEKLDL